MSERKSFIDRLADLTLEEAVALARMIVKNCEVNATEEDYYDAFAYLERQPKKISLARQGAKIRPGKHAWAMIDGAPHKVRVLDFVPDQELGFVPTGQARGKWRVTPLTNKLNKKLTIERRLYVIASTEQITVINRKARRDNGR